MMPLFKAVPKNFSFITTHDHHKMHKSLFNILVFLNVFLLVVSSCNNTPPVQNSTNRTVPTLNSPFSTIDTIIAKEAPSKITRMAMKDAKENIWIASWNGIIKYDGQKFYNLTKEISNSNFFAVLEDSKGNIWMASIGDGVYCYNGVSFQHFTSKEGLIHDQVTNIYEDKAGRIWLGTAGGISCFDGRNFQNFTTADGLSNNDVNSIIEDQEGTFWIGTRGSACFYDSNTGIFKTIINTATGKSLENVRHIIKDTKGAIWLGGQDGLWRYNDQNFQQVSENFTAYLLETADGQIWTSAQDQTTALWEIAYYSSTTTFINTPIATKLITGQKMTFGLLEDQNRHIWYGGLNGVYRYNKVGIHYFKGR